MNNRPPLMPSDTPDEAAIAWLDCLRFHVSKPEILDLYRAETGDQWRPATDPLSSMVDEATGRSEQWVKDFVRWFNDRIWGPWEGEVGHA